MAVPWLRKKVHYLQVPGKICPVSNPHTVRIYIFYQRLRQAQPTTLWDTEGLCSYAHALDELIINFCSPKLFGNAMLSRYLRIYMLW